jgi:general secretion pathway protein L
VLEVRAPVRDRAQLLRALPALVEDRLTSDVETMHLSAGPIGEDGTLRVVAIEHAAIEALLAALAAAGLDPEALLPDALCLPGTADQVVLLGDRCLLRTRQRAAAVAPAVAALLLASEPLGERVELAHAGEETAALGPVRAALAARGIAIEERPAARHELERALLRGARAAAAHDLRHGRHRRRGAERERWRAWRVPAGLAALWLVLVVAALAIEVGGLLRERARLDAELAALLPQAAPEALGQPDPRFYLDQRLKRRGGSGGVALEDVVRAAGALRAVGGTELMLVDAREGALELGVRATDLAALDAARGAVASALARGVELRGAASTGGKAEGRLVVALLQEAR